MKGKICEIGSTVTIVMCTFNGAKFLKEQLQSFSVQSHLNWRLYVSDDGSTDATLGLLTSFKERVREANDVDVVLGPRSGVVANFLSAICAAPGSDFCAVSDQDDVWEPQKLSRAVERLNQISPGKPALYCARTRIADLNGKEVRLSALFARRPDFANALVQNIGGGNTMVFNRAAHEIVRKGGSQLEVAVHDWWLYQLISGAGGEVIYDPEPHILYRQHDSNLIGENSSLRARLKRSRQLMNGLFKGWMDQNLAALDGVKHLLTVENRELLHELMNLRKRSFWQRTIGLRKLGINRQTLAGNISLAVAAALGKL